jgi:acylphosphatase
MKKAAILTVSGRVQNVGFRFNTLKAAKKNEIYGIVKNLHDGSVYIEAEGEEENLDQFILWCHQGPNWARVDHVNIQHSQVQDYKDFSIK